MDAVRQHMFVMRALLESEVDEMMLTRVEAICGASGTRRSSFHKRGFEI